MNPKNTKIIRAKSNGKQLLSPEPQPKTQTSSQNLIKKQQPRPVNPPKSKQDIQKKNNNKKQSPPPTPKQLPHESRSNSSSSINGSELSKEDLLRMEIKQLKRQNQFLRKKIQEFSDQQSHPPTNKIKHAHPKTQQPKTNELKIHLNINYFFKEIKGLMQAVAKLFNIDLDPTPTLQNNFNSEQQLSKDKAMQNTSQQLCKKLQKILLEEETHKYNHLLDVFAEYYRQKQANELHIVRHLEANIEKANQLNKYLVEKAQMKKNKTDAYSISQKQSVLTIKDQTNDLLKTPYTQPTTRSTYSPNHKYYPTHNRKVDHSP